MVDQNRCNESGRNQQSPTQAWALSAAIWTLGEALRGIAPSGSTDE
ncbi:MAG: hypothetical protein JWP55_4735 [Mycobacterium sp.]|nr:hypothetical protein [Mycobacterium sp.]